MTYEAFDVVVVPFPSRWACKSALTADSYGRVEEAVIKLWSRAIKLSCDKCLGINEIAALRSQ